MTWKHSHFYPKKYQSFHGCNLTISTLKGKSSENDWKVGEELSKVYNFTINYGFVETFEEFLSFNEVDLSNIAERFNSDKGFITSVPYFIESIKFVVPPGELDTPFEKMFLMFDYGTWMAISVTLSAGLICIQVINLMSLKVQNLFYGNKIRTPTINFISIFLNGSQFKFPLKSFSRFMVVLFVIWSIIIRTCYQSEQI